MKTSLSFRTPHNLIGFQSMRGEYEEDWQEKARQLQKRRWQAIKKAMQQQKVNDVPYNKGYEQPGVNTSTKGPYIFRRP